MNLLRLGLLLLLVLALPVRATLGAVPPVLGDARGASIEAVGPSGDDADAPSCEHAAAGADAAHAHDAGRTACHACDACCAASAPPAALPEVAAPSRVVAAAFPAPPCRASSFLGDAPRRPPRRC